MPRAEILSIVALVLLANNGCSLVRSCETPEEQSLIRAAIEATQVDLEKYEPVLKSSIDGLFVLFHDKGELVNGEVVYSIDANFIVEFDKCGRIVGSRGAI